MPIIVAEIDGEEVLIDGRARIKACAAAGIEVRRESLAPDADPERAVWSMNAVRMNFSPSQRAMGIAWLYPEPGTGTKVCAATQAAIDEAREILRFDRVVAQAVINGGFDSAGYIYTLRRALVEVRQRAWDMAWHDAQMERLKREAIGLLYEVQEEEEERRMPLEQAVAILDRRQDGKVWDATERPIIVLAPPPPPRRRKRISRASE
jgi:hypothetical protein